jgi:hypothetical protein
VTTIYTQEHRGGTSEYLGEDVYEQQILNAHERIQPSTDMLVDILREQLRLMLEREREHTRLYEAREQAYREHIAQLATMLHEAQPRYDRLLDMPRSTPPPGPISSSRTEIPREAPKGAPRGGMRRRIVVLLQDHPEGLTPAEMRALLGVDKSLADTCLGMLRYGLVHRVGHGRYVATESSRNDHE